MKLVQMKVVRVSVRKEIVRWAVERSGTAEEKLQSRFAHYRDWESGEKAPTLKQLEVLAQYLRDAKVFIQGKNLHYGFDLCRGFREWLLRQNEALRVYSIERVVECYLVAHALARDTKYLCH